MKKRLQLSAPSIVCCLLILMLRVGALCAEAADQAAARPSATTQSLVLPGLGLAQHSFLYTGEWDHRNAMQTIFVVRDGRRVWTYQIPLKDPDGAMEELGDATMLSNGNHLDEPGSPNLSAFP